MKSIYNFNNFYEIILAGNKYHKHKIAIFDNGVHINYAELKNYVDIVANFLSLNVGVKQHDKVLVMLGNSWQFTVVLFAICKLGAIAVPINYFLTNDEVSYIAADSQAKAIFISEKFTKNIAEILSRKKYYSILVRDSENIRPQDQHHKHDNIDCLFDNIINQTTKTTSLASIIKAYLLDKILTIKYKLCCKHAVEYKYIHDTKSAEKNNHNQNKTLHDNICSNQQNNNILCKNALNVEIDHDCDFAKSAIDDLAVIVYTSGTTGRPKGAMLSYKNLISNCYMCRDIMTKTSSVICYLPVFHVFTLTTTIIFPLLHFMPIVMIRSISTRNDFKNLFTQILLHRCTYFTGVPEVYNMMSKANLPWYFHRFHNIKGFISGASSLSHDTINNFNKTFKRGVLLQGYGISECSPVIACNTILNNRFGSVGKPITGCEVIIIDEEHNILPCGQVGEICTQGDNVMLGYYNLPDETQAVFFDNWFKTGDLGKFDEDGFLYIVDRKKDLIVHKGMNIYPKEIEVKLSQYYKIKECAVIGATLDEIKSKQQNKPIDNNHSNNHSLDHHNNKQHNSNQNIDDDNQYPVAYVELNDNIDDGITDAEVREFLKDKLASFKLPKKVIVIDKLPKNATGKILKKELRNKMIG